MVKTIIDLIKNLFTWLVIIAPWERAVRVRGGKHAKTMEPGCHLRIPFWDRFYKQSIRRRSVVIPPVTVTTKNKSTITIGGFLWYEISDITKLYNTLHDAQDTIESEVCGIISDFVTNNASNDCECKSIRDHVLNKIDIERYGLTGADFAISTHAEHKTFRLIDGGAYAWSGGDRLETTKVEG